MRRLKLLTALTAMALLAVACGGGGTKHTANNSKNNTKSGPGGTVTISNESGTLWTCGFNPFNLNTTFLIFGPVYEPLVFINTLQNAKATPWLASSYAWSNNNKTITFTIRPGVKWTDGQPFTADDVVFTFDLIKKHSALDLNSVWSVLSSVTKQGTDKVVMNFKTAAVPYFYYIADQVSIVPQHLWASVADPVTFNDPHPVGTGAFTMSKCTGQNITYTRNPSYWQPGMPKIQTVQYPAFTSNDPANQYLAIGRAQWGSQFIPNIKAFYLSKSSNHHIWFPPYANVSLFLNQKDPLLSNVAVRRAIAYAIDRNRVSQLGEYGYEPPSNQAGIVTPTFSSWLDTAQLAKYDNYSYNPAKAQQILTAAGFKKGSDGIFRSPSGKPLSFSVVNQAGYSDWVAALQIVADNLKAVGIKLTLDNLTQTDYNAKLFAGKFQMGYYAETAGPLPYYELRQWLYSANSAPIGTNAVSNFERYSNPTVDKLLDQYGATTDSATQHSIINQLQGYMLSDVPVVPLTEEVTWYQYDTTNLTGWVTPDNPYALPAAYSYPDWGVHLLHLQSK